MPELPEVETIARLLREGTADSPSLVGRKATGCLLLWKRSLERPSEFELLTKLPGQTLTTIDRRGKFLQLHFDQDTLLFHLRMSGDLVAESEQGLVNREQGLVNREQGLEQSEQSSTLNPHARFVLYFKENVQLLFVDPRKFGRIWLVRDPQEVLGELGPEPLDPGFTAEAFHKRLIDHRKMLKTLLLDQTFLAGLGNIYADESLNLARLHPCVLSNNLSLKDADVLLGAIRTVLNHAIQRNGSSIDWVYRGGNFQNYFRAYQRTGQPCLNCGTPIERIRMGQRGTHFCPNCQRL